MDTYIKANGSFWIFLGDLFVLSDDAIKRENNAFRSI